MAKRIGHFEQAVIEKLKSLPESKKIEALDFLDYLTQRFVSRKNKIDQAVLNVENSWSSVHIDKDILRFVAEDKELEYEL